MKKIIASLIILMLMVTSCGLVFAEPETDDGTGAIPGTETSTGNDENQEEPITPNVTLNMTESFTTTVDATSVTIKLGFNNVQGLEEGTVVSFKGILQYDSSIITGVTVEGLNGYTATYAPETHRIVVDPKEAIAGTEIVNITLTLAEGVQPCTTTVNFQMEEFTDGTNDFELNTYTSAIAIKENIPEQPETPEQPNDDQNQTPTDPNNTNTPTDNTIADKDLPKAGMKTLMTLIAIVGIVGVLALVRYKKIQIK